MWDKNKVYGYSEDYIMENGEPADNSVMIEGNEEEVLTKEEIDRMFPCQVLALTNVKWIDKENDHFNFVSATVKYYHCDIDDATVMELSGEIDYAYVHIPDWMDGDLLWF